MTLVVPGGDVAFATNELLNRRARSARNNEGDVRGDGEPQNGPIVERTPVDRKQVTSRNALLSVAEAAILLGIDRATCYRAIRNETLPVPVVRLGGRIRIPRRAVERLLDGAEQPTAASQSHQLASAADSCPVCGSPAPSAPTSPPRRRPICSAARRSSSAITPV